MFGNGFYNPYTYQPYQVTNTARNFGSLFNTTNASSNIGRTAGITGIFKNFSLSSFLTGASKTLNVVNQAIPVYYQIKPMFNNAKTMFRIMNAVKDDGNSKINNNNQTSNNTIINDSSVNYNAYKTEESSENPVFFI